MVTLNARQLVGDLLARRLTGPAALFAPLVASALRDFTGGLSINRSGLTGHFKLTIVK